MDVTVGVFGASRGDCWDRTEADSDFVAVVICLGSGAEIGGAFSAGNV